MTVSPAAALNLGTTPGLNHFKLGISRKDAYTEYDMPALLLAPDLSPNFLVTPEENVRFQVDTNGKPTSGSKYPRVEAREENGDGTLIGWDGRTGIHWMEVTLRFLALPVKRPWACGTQIHGPKDDLIRFQVEGSDLSHLKLVARNTPPGSKKEVATTIRPSYQLGTWVTVRFEIKDGAGSLLLDGVKVLDFDARSKGLYWKWGIYLQANTSNGGVATGVVEVRKDSVRHWHPGWPMPSSVPVSVGAAGTVVGSDPTTVPAPPSSATPVVVPPAAPPTTATTSRVIMIVRHAEKPDDDSIHTLSDTGLLRASRLPHLFTPALLTGLFMPTDLWASEGNSASRRPIQTITPLSDALKLPVNTKYEAAAYKDCAKALLKQRTGVSLVCWAHGEIPGLVKALGVTTPKMFSTWPDNRFDVILVLVTDGSGGWHLTQVTEGLLPGDRSVGI